MIEFFCGIIWYWFLQFFFRLLHKYKLSILLSTWSWQSIPFNHLCFCLFLMDVQNWQVKIVIATCLSLIIDLPIFEWYVSQLQIEIGIQNHHKLRGGNFFFLHYCSFSMDGSLIILHCPIGHDQKKCVQIQNECSRSVSR